MVTVKRYGQFCSLARALDELGDRWTLLIIRELLIAPGSYTSLQGRLPGIATNLLAERLARLQTGALILRSGDGKYELTDRGEALAPAVRELIRWGAPLMFSGAGDDHVDPSWGRLALEALLASSEPMPVGAVAVSCGDATFSIVMGALGREVVPEVGRVGATVTAVLPDLLAAAHTGRVGPSAEIEGSRALARRAFRGTRSQG